MTDTQIIATTVASTAALLFVEVYVGYLAGHTADIAVSWREGREQAAKWLRPVVTQALYVLTVAELWLLLHLGSVRKGGA